jgi:hypothetical protein
MSMKIADRMLATTVATAWAGIPHGMDVPPLADTVVVISVGPLGACVEGFRIVNEPAEIGNTSGQYQCAVKLTPCRAPEDSPFRVGMDVLFYPTAPGTTWGHIEPI